MKLDLIRAIDKWVGIPACFAVSVVHGILDRFWSARSGAPPRKAAPKRFLLLELSEMGSTVLAYPAMKYVKARYPGAELYFLIFAQNRFSVDMLDVIPQNRVLTISVDSPLAFLYTTLRTLWMMRRAKLDVVFDLELFSRFSSLLSGLSGAGLRAGYGDTTRRGSIEATS